MYLIITEKPSVAKNIADALSIKNRKNGYFENSDYFITWAFGHLLELYDCKDYDKSMITWRLKDFPFIPEEFKYKIKSDQKNKDKVDLGAKNQLNIIKNLANNKKVSVVISACDFDREGQIIGDIILDYLNVKKPIKRLLLNEWTPDEILKGLKNLKPNKDLKSVSDAGICRQWADWIIGINLTSIATLKYSKNKVINIGRVLLPTLKIIYDRDKEIENFISEDYYKLNGTFSTDDGRIYEGIYFEKQQDKFNNKKDLNDIINKSKDKKATIIKKEVKRKKEYPPYLFNLSNLQGYITSKYNGWTSDKVLKIAQSLYEKKLITYPRTASIALEESLIDKTKKVLNILKKGLSYEKDIKFSKSTRIFDNKKVKGHSAIIPTYLKPNKLTKDEDIIYQEIKDRFIMQFMPVSEYDETTIVTKIKEQSIKGFFITKGRILIVEGWKKVQKINTKDIILPNLILNETVNIEELEISSHKTKPPNHHTEKTLLKVMETCGKGYDKKRKDNKNIMEFVLSGFNIGTPATRADIIKKLKTVEYIKTKNKFLVCSELGKNIIENFPIRELLDLEYTGKLEKTLLDIEEGKVTKNNFLKFIFDFTEKSVEKIKNDGGVILCDNEKTEVLGLCPKCGAGVVENSKTYGCSDWKNGCKFSIWKNDKFLASMKKKLTKKMVRELLKNGEVKVCGLVSKKGNKFDAILSYSENKETGYYNWNMRFFDKKSN